MGNSTELQVMKAVHAVQLEAKDALHLKDVQNVTLKKELEAREDLEKKQQEIILLDMALKNSMNAVLIAKQAYSARAALETIIIVKYIAPTISKSFEACIKDPAVQLEFQKQCRTFNCLGYAKNAGKNLYSNLSANLHGAGYPIAIHTKDKILTPAEWALLVAIFKLNLAADAFKVFDENDNELIV
jgi:hypothetical protein